jgi:hypothetical protein
VRGSAFGGKTRTERRLSDDIVKERRRASSPPLASGKNVSVEVSSSGMKYRMCVATVSLDPAEHYTRRRVLRNKTPKALPLSAVMCDHQPLLGIRNLSRRI